MADAQNPYAPPEAQVNADVVPAGADGDAAAAEHTRRQYVRHEAAVRSVGTLYIFGAVIMVISVIVLFFSGALTQDLMLPTALMTVFGSGMTVLGRAVRALRPWARYVAGALAGIGLLGFPVGTLINVYVLYLLFSDKGAMVFSPHYARIIELTPQVKYRSSAVVWLVVALLVVFLLLAMFMGMMARVT